MCKQVSISIYVSRMGRKKKEKRAGLQKDGVFYDDLSLAYLKTQVRVLSPCGNSLFLYQTQDFNNNNQGSIFNSLACPHCRLTVLWAASSTEAPEPSEPLSLSRRGWGSDRVGAGWGWGGKRLESPSQDKTKQKAWVKNAIFQKKMITFWKRVCFCVHPSEDFTSTLLA